MIVEPTAISDVLLLQPLVFTDDRGYFMESFKQSIFEEYLGKTISFCQDNESLSTFGVLRGLHYQLPPFAQSKLVRVIKGAVLDVAVDIRKASPTFGKYIAVELNETNKKQLFIPRGFAHGFLVLSQECIFSYKVDNYYDKASERSIAYNDPKLAIDWKLSKENIILSEKDKILPNLADIAKENLFHHNTSYYA